MTAAVRQARFLLRTSSVRRCDDFGHGRHESQLSHPAAMRVARVRLGVDPVDWPATEGGFREALQFFRGVSFSHGPFPGRVGSPRAGPPSGCIGGRLSQHCRQLLVQQADLDPGDDRVPFIRTQSFQSAFVVSSACCPIASSSGEATGPACSSSSPCLPAGEQSSGTPPESDSPAPGAGTPAALLRRDFEGVDLLKCLEERFLDKVVGIGHVPGPLGKAAGGPPTQERQVPREESVQCLLIAVTGTLQQLNRGLGISEGHAAFRAAPFYCRAVRFRGRRHFYSVNQPGQSRCRSSRGEKPCTKWALSLSLGRYSRSVRFLQGRRRSPVFHTGTARRHDERLRSVDGCGRFAATASKRTFWEIRPTPTGRMGSGRVSIVGNVIIDFQTTRAKIRGLVYKSSGAISAPPGGGSNHYFSTIGLAPGGALQAMTPGGPTINVASCPLYDDDSGQPQYRHSFSRDCQSGFGSVGSPLVVTRTSASTWEIVPMAPATSRVFSITTKGRVQVHDFGDFTLPFTMTLTAKH